MVEEKDTLRRQWSRAGARGARPLSRTIPGRMYAGSSPGKWTTREIALAGLFAALTAVAAQITIPLPFVPLTLQTLATMLAGAILGGRAGALSQTAYLLMGFAGLPVFAGRTGGIQHLFGFTGGYLIGFVLCAWVVGRALERSSKVTATRGILAMAAGILAIYIPGVLVLAVHIGSIPRAVVLGALQFLPADAIKAVIAVGIVRGLESRGVRRVIRVRPESRGR